ncbi:High potential iron-sulfur protein [Halobacteria archaeon AArc-curdl1]|uniref:High potential iron-sulfur protein n=1 Tax=Natronosalvus hydrolyticus TaxID=2979988 RepID=A0AAP2Z6T2_9EURY|nr:High potential iron-sulfur protein [Halobacteria archaeon AArc-curdl1]
MLQIGSTTSLLGLAGCAEFVGIEDEDPEPEPREPDWCIEEYDEPVPEAQETGESIDGIERDPDDLNSRYEVAYQCHPQGFQLCANCRYFILPDDDDVPIGACAIVDGRVRSQDWCGLYEHTERLDEPPDPAPFD